MSRLSAAVRHKIAFTLNDAPVTLEAEPRLLVTDALRHGLGATGTHVGCEHGVCGACTILIDGAPARACLTLAVQLEGRKVTTVEGLAPERDRLSVLQATFRRHHALQCGFCTAGILMSLDAFLREQPAPSEAELREIVGGHLCRCTGYTPIIAAALDAAAQLRELAGSSVDKRPTHV
jgi:2-furoyl-CoA dehydrogenase 2Fe-2S iron sulfur subunit